jgi:hypothetical protein
MLTPKVFPEWWELHGQGIMDFPECLVVVLGEKMPAHEMSPSKWLTLAKFEDLTKIIVVNGKD